MNWNNKTRTIFQVIFCTIQLLGFAIWLVTENNIAFIIGFMPIAAIIVLLPINKENKR